MNRRSFIKSTGIASLGLSLKIDKTFSQLDNSSVDPLVSLHGMLKKQPKRHGKLYLQTEIHLMQLSRGV